MFLITGTNGSLGSELSDLFSEDEVFRCNGRSHMNICDVESIKDYCYDFGDVLYDVKALVHCAAFTDVAGAETRDGRVRAIETNIIGTKNIIERICNVYNIKMIYISTDYVYAGECGGYTETSMIKPVNAYASTKYMGESYMRNDDLIIRTSFKPKGKWKYDVAFDDLYTSSDYVDVIAPMIKKLIINDAVGVYNVGTERKTIYDLASRRNQEVKPISTKEVGSFFPKDISMNMDKYNLFCSNLKEKENGR